MKRMILGAAFNRDVALKHLARHSEQIRDHVVKCVVYKDIRKDSMRHWIHEELGVWFSEASKVSAKTKLKKQDYLDTVFREFGDQPVDCRIILSEFREDYCKNNDYPEFVITPKLVSDLFSAINAIESNTLPMLSAKQPYSSEQFSAVLDNILL